MHFGTYMGVYWILKFILFPLGLSIPFLLFLFFGLTLGVPFMGYYYARTYRDKVCGGSIRFLQAWVFIVFYVYVCGTPHGSGPLHLFPVHRPWFHCKHLHGNV